jgi:hypothetical protein
MSRAEATCGVCLQESPATRSGQWIDLVHGRRPPRGIVLDMDSSVSPTHGEAAATTSASVRRWVCPPPNALKTHLGSNFGCVYRWARYRKWGLHMPAEWLLIANGVTGIAEKIFSGLGRYEKLKAEDRARAADPLSKTDMLTVYSFA